jgi:hypothetical protein
MNISIPRCEAFHRKDSLSPVLAQQKIIDHRTLYRHNAYSIECCEIKTLFHFLLPIRPTHMEGESGKKFIGKNLFFSLRERKITEISILGNLQMRNEVRER